MTAWGFEVLSCLACPDNSLFLASAARTMDLQARIVPLSIATWPFQLVRSVVIHHLVFSVSVLCSARHCAAHKQRNYMGCCMYREGEEGYMLDGTAGSVNASPFCWCRRSLNRHSAVWLYALPVSSLGLQDWLMKLSAPPERQTLRGTPLSLRNRCRLKRNAWSVLSRLARVQ